ncbi:MAG: sugar-transfer associated ATP-grasp domain-containing protein [Pseudomonadota bacterium]|uniref:sugar-transfer associated ATP-grasp domain-containing protein n=3 Tax=Sphingobium sp. TaxID=1912891 RepID=UPI002E1F6B6C
MLTQRALPVRPDRTNSLLALYHDGLARHWPASRRLAGHALWAAGRGGWSPAEQLYLGEQVRAHGLSMRDRKGLHRLLNGGAFPLRVNPLKNKQLFAERGHGLPLPDAWDGRTDLRHWLEGQQDIIAKPSFRSKGQGVERFTREGALWRSGEKRQTAVPLAVRLSALARRGGVIQTRLPTHGALADLSPGALPTLRVVTCVDGAGVARVCATALRLSAGGPRPVDNFNAGNLVLAVDASGRCGPAWRSGGNAAPPSRHSRHPLTGAAIEGATLPDHDAALALAIAAHDRFRDGFTVIGWDIGITAAGPVLIEGNWNPGTDILQLVEGRGLSQSPLGALYRDALARLSPDVWRSARAVEREPR